MYYKLIAIGVILLFTLLVILSLAGVLTARRKSWGRHSTRLVGLAIIVCTILLVCIISDIKDSGTVFTLLGTIAGYFLGQGKLKDDEEGKR